MTLKHTDGLLLEPGATALVTTDSWFIGPDGRDYKGAYGPCTVIEAKDLLGLAPKSSANWYLQVGYGNKMVIIAGCQVHYAAMPAQCPQSPAIWDAS